MPTDVLLIVVATEFERPTAPGAAEVLVCGVGKTGAAAATVARLTQGGVAAVVSFGVAGAYPASSLELGDVVVGTECAILDEGLETGAGFTPFARPGMTVPGGAWQPCDADLLDRLVSAPAPAFRVESARIATVSVCAGTARLAEERGRTGAVAEGMEGAAIAYAAALFRVPFAEVRGVSNRCGPREGAPFDLSGAVANASSVLARLLR